MKLAFLHPLVIVGCLITPSGPHYSRPTLKNLVAVAALINHVPYGLMVGIANKESSWKYQAKNINLNGTYDWGLFQINSVWKKSLHLTADQLMCPLSNAMVAGYILHHYYQRFGSWWNVAESYHMGHPDTPGGKEYAKYVWRFWNISEN